MRDTIANRNNASAAIYVTAQLNRRVDQRLRMAKALPAFSGLPSYPSSGNSVILQLAQMYSMPRSRIESSIFIHAGKENNGVLICIDFSPGDERSQIWSGSVTGGAML
jgi:hypothetical protein